MEIFGMGMWEILLIIVIAIIIWGPANIVGFSKGLGRLVRNLKKMTSDFTNQVSSEVEEKKMSTDAHKAQSSDEPERK
jgi:sec-independent protein translocase protein TatA